MHHHKEELLARTVHCGLACNAMSSTSLTADVHELRDDERLGAFPPATLFAAYAYELPICWRRRRKLSFTRQRWRRRQLRACAAAGVHDRVIV